MQLEDHLGDILRKGRMRTGVSLAQAAAASGMSAAAYQRLEETGCGPETFNTRAVAELLGLNANKLAGIVAGWLPQPQNLARWRHLQVFVSTDADLTVNSFLFWDEPSRAAALVDTGLAPEQILEFLQARQLQLQRILITHSHYDHVDGLPALRAAWPDVVCHSGSPHAPSAQRLEAGKILSVGNLQITHRATPGHAADGVTYVVSGWPADAPAVAFVGDAIFAGSLGRGNDSWELAQRKVREAILTLPPATLLCPGHGPLTTVGEELASNPFF